MPVPGRAEPRQFGPAELRAELCVLKGACDIRRGLL